MVGRATLTMVKSTMVMKYATANRANARQRCGRASSTARARPTSRWHAAPVEEELVCRMVIGPLVVGSSCVVFAFERCHGVPPIVRVQVFTR